MGTGPITGPITDTGATITGHTGGIIQGTATGVTAITVVTGITGVTAITVVTAITGVTAATSVRDRQTLRPTSSSPLLL
jgi:hypothetical protein